MLARGTLLLLLFVRVAVAGDAIVLYPAYVSEGAGTIEGRVTARENGRAATVDESRWSNLRRNLAS
jgi:hypothetical protein